MKSSGSLRCFHSGFSTSRSVFTKPGSIPPSSRRPKLRSVVLSSVHLRASRSSLFERCFLIARDRLKTSAAQCKREADTLFYESKGKSLCFDRD